MKKLRTTLSTILLATFVVAGVSYAQAWIGPGSNPPEGNTPAPINVSDATQEKEGEFTVLDNFFANTVSTLGFILQDGTEGDGKVLVSDENGVASWQDANLSGGGAVKVLDIKGSAGSDSGNEQMFSVTEVRANTLLSSNPSTSAITIPEAGDYDISIGVEKCASGTSGSVVVAIIVDGVEKTSANNPSSPCGSSFDRIVLRMNAGQTVSGLCRQNRGYGGNCRMQVVKLGSSAGGSGGDQTIIEQMVFGDWEVRNIDTIYTADTHGMVVFYAHCNAASCGGRLRGITDANATPTTVIAEFVTLAGGNTHTGTFPVKKGDKWRVQNLNGDNITSSVKWMPVVEGGGSGGSSATVAGVHFKTDSTYNSISKDVTYQTPLSLNVPVESGEVVSIDASVSVLQNPGCGDCGSRFYVRLKRDSTIINEGVVEYAHDQANEVVGYQVPVVYVDTPTAGTHVYSIEILCVSNGSCKYNNSSSIGRVGVSTLRALVLKN